MFKKLCTLTLFVASAIALSAAPALADTHPFTIDNKGGHQIDRVYLSPISADRWGPDRMGKYVLAPNHHQTWNIETNCEMDVKILYHDGTIKYKRDFDTCKYDLDMYY